MTATRLAAASLEQTDREAWLELRRGGIGGSDAPAIMGMDGYSTAWRLWLEKVTGHREEYTEDQLEQMEFGHEMEALIARRWARRTGIPGRMARVGMLAHPRHGWMRVNLDRRVSDCGLNRGPCLLECKHRSAFQGGQWSRTGDPEDIPDGPALQVQHALMITGYSHGHLAAELGHRLLSYVIEADPRLQKTMTDEESWFWHDHVLAKVPPPIDGTERTARILDMLWGADPAKVLMGAADIVALAGTARAARAAATRADLRAGQAENELKQAMGDHEVLTDADGHRVATWKRNGTFRAKAYLDEAGDSAIVRQLTVPDLAALAAAQPETYRKYRARVLRVAAGRKD